MLRKPYCSNLMFTSTNDNILYYTIVSFTFLVNPTAIIQILTAKLQITAGTQCTSISSSSSIGQLQTCIVYID